MVVTLFCPNLKCRAILQVPDTARGKKVRCGQCGATFMVPEKKEPTAVQPSETPASEPENSDK